MTAKCKTYQRFCQRCSYNWCKKCTFLCRVHARDGICTNLPVHKASTNIKPFSLLGIGGMQNHYCNAKGHVWSKSRRKTGVWELAPRKSLMVTLYRTLESALLEYGIAVAIIIDLCAQKEGWPANEGRTSYVDPSFCYRMPVVQS